MFLIKDKNHPNIIMYLLISLRLTPAQNDFSLINLCAKVTFLTEKSNKSLKSSLPNNKKPFDNSFKPFKIILSIYFFSSSSFKLPKSKTKFNKQ